jgi:hypothetical protein
MEINKIRIYTLDTDALIVKIVILHQIRIV